MTEPQPSFGAVLRRLRLGREATIVQTYHGTPRIKTRTLSQNELARRAGVDVSYISRLERGLPTDPRTERSTPSRAVVEQLADALELDTMTASLLLTAAGYWPWTGLDEDTAALVVQTAMGVLAGDYRVLDGEP